MPITLLPLPPPEVRVLCSNSRDRVRDICSARLCAPTEGAGRILTTETRFSGIELASLEDISNNGSILNLNLYVKPGVRFYNCTPYYLRIIAPILSGGWGERALSKY
ncbi:hypothetical protein IQ272_15835 [Chroococcidiopsidales cyanobacterium LEGE 13417]|nr:hypothetical protein [Chroococcidiopsidales cyanobacterium LEGE 13417]